MKVFYYPLHSQDFSFENIFSTESISPPAFYSARGFGIEYWRLIPELQNENAIILYDAPPSFEIDNSSENVRYILQFIDATLDVTALHDIGGGMFSYTKTIYLNKVNFKVLFFSDRDLKLTLLRTDVSLPTKDLNKYKNNFEVISEMQCRSYNTYGTHYVDLTKSTQEQEIEFDRKFNSFKGLIYGLLIGQLTSAAPKELALKKSLRELNNRFAELRNRIEHRIGTSWNKSRENDGILLLGRELQRFLRQIEDSFISLFPEEAVTTSDLAYFILSKIPHRIASYEDALRYVNDKLLDDELFTESNYQKLVSLYYQSNSNKYILGAFQDLRKQLDEDLKLLMPSEQRTLQRERAAYALKNTLNQLEGYLDSKMLAKPGQRPIDLSKIHYDFRRHEIDLSEMSFELERSGVQDLQILINIILQNPRPSKRHPSRERILRVIEEASNSLANAPQSNLLYKYLNNEVTSYSFEKISSTVQKNFVAFTFNPDSVEKLVAFNQAKDIEQHWISYVFWCAYNGFANIGKNFLRPIFGRENFELQDDVDRYLFTYLNPSKASNLTINYIPSEQPNPLFDSQSQLDREFRTFYERHILNKYRIGLEDLRILATITDRNKFNDTLKSQFQVAKRDATKIFDALFSMRQSRQLFN